MTKDNQEQNTEQKFDPTTINSAGLEEVLRDAGLGKGVTFSAKEIASMLEEAAKRLNDRRNAAKTGKQETGYSR